MNKYQCSTCYVVWTDDSKTPESSKTCEFCKQNKFDELSTINKFMFGENGESDKTIKITTEHNIGRTCDDVKFGLKGGNKPTCPLYSYGNLVNITFEAELPSNVELFQENWECSIIERCSFEIAGNVISELNKHDIYENNLKRQIIRKTDKKISMDLPFFFNEENPIYCEDIYVYDMRINLKMGEDKFYSNGAKNIIWKNPKIIFTYQQPHSYLLRDIMKDPITPFVTDYNKCQDDIVENQSLFSLSHIIDFKGPIDEISFCIWDEKSTKCFDYLDMMSYFRIEFQGQGHDYHQDKIEASDTKQDGNIYKIKFVRPINFTKMDSVKLTGSFKNDTNEKYKDSKLYYRISAISKHKILYNTNNIKNDANSYVNHNKYIDDTMGWHTVS